MSPELEDRARHFFETNGSQTTWWHLKKAFTVEELAALKQSGLVWTKGFFWRWRHQERQAA